MRTHLEKSKFKKNINPGSEIQLKKNGQKTLQFVNGLEKIKNTSIIQREGYTFKELIERIKEKYPNGICTTLTAAWLTGQLNASSKDNSSGVTNENFNIILSLENFLEWTKKFSCGMDSRDITWAILPYLQIKGQEWLKELPFLHEKDFITEAEIFEHWIRYGGYKPSKKLVEKTTEEEAGNGKTSLTREKARPYNQLTKSVISEAISNALVQYFNLGTSFKGIVTIKAFSSTKEDYFLGHEFAIKHDISDDYTNNHFSIYDQNKGLIKQKIENEDDIIEILANHISDAYITNPFKGSDSAFISVMIDFA